MVENPTLVYAFAGFPQWNRNPIKKNSLSNIFSEIILFFYVIIVYITKCTVKTKSFFTFLLYTGALYFFITEKILDYSFIIKLLLTNNPLNIF